MTLREPAEPKKRQRHVYPTDEIPHLWMHQTQDSARNPGGNLYFDGPTIYSYGSHFPIATIVTRGTGKRQRKCVLFTACDYSVTTSGHKSAVRRAIPGEVPVFVMQLRETWGTVLPSYESVRADYLSQFHERIKARDGARSGRMMLEAHNRAIRALSDFREYCKFFGLKTGKLPKFPPIDQEKMARAVEFDNTREQRKREKRERAEARRRELEEKKEVYRQQWIDGQQVPYSAGELFGWNYRDGVKLRVYGEELETSMGARVPVDHAWRVYQILKRLRERGETYQRNGHTIHLGHYSLDSLTADGTVTAGCHVVTWKEIERIAPQLQRAAESQAQAQAQVEDSSPQQ